MGVSYEYSIGSVRAKEVSLLSKQDIERMLSMTSENELSRFLTDKGIGNGSTPGEIADDYMAKTWEYINSINPDESILLPFLYQNDIHNLKAVLKGTLADREYKSLIMEPYSIEPDIIIDAVKNGKYSLLPQWIGGSAQMAYKSLAETSDARLSDAMLDKGALDKILDVCKNSGNDFLMEYYLTFAFFANVKIALRASRTGCNAHFLDTALCSFDGLYKERLKSAALRSEETLLEALSKISDFGCNKAVEEYKKSPALFERFTDNCLMDIAKSGCKYAGDGAAPMLGYILAVMAEIKAIHIINVGIRTGADIEKTRERLREIYG